jgi:carboxyl-terminal processing protease
MPRSTFPFRLSWAYALVTGLGLLLWRAGSLPAAENPGGKESAPPAAAAAAKPARPPDDDYLRLFKLFADAFDQVDRNYVKEVDRRRLMEAAIRGMLSELDPYSGYISPQQLQAFKSGVEAEFGGVGVQVTVESGHLVVISPLVGSPAYRAGVAAGDRILEIDGRSADGITVDEAVRRMQGRIGDPVVLKIKHPQASDAETLNLRRELIRMETVMGDVRLPNDQWKWMYDEEKKLGYIRVNAFGRHTAEELRKALEDLTKQQLRGLVLDLRFNPGGLLPAAIEVADLFVSSGRIVSTEGRNTKTKTWDAREPGTFSRFPMAVLVNRYSASASEIVAACLQDHARAVIVGERTWGKGSVQNVVDLEDGASLLKLTTADYHRPSGKNIHRYPDSTEKDTWGVVPNEGFQVALSRAEMTQLTDLRRAKDVVRKPAESPSSPAPAAPAFVDRQLQKALEYLSQHMSPPTPDGTVTAHAEPAVSPPK